MRVAYFTNKYPAVSHTFIRREIRALEAQGMTIVRYALRSEEGIVDDEDWAELQKTKYILKSGVGEMLHCLSKVIVRQTTVTVTVIKLALRMGWRSDRGLLRHLAYILEAIVLAEWCRRDGVQHLHAHFGTNPAAVAMLASRFANIPFSFTAHGPDEFDRASVLSLDHKVANASFVICVSMFGRAQMMRWSSPQFWDKIAVVHCGLDSDFLTTDLLPITSAPRLVCVGRISEQKAQLVLIEAIGQLRDAGIDCHLVLAGDGPMRRKVEDRIREADLERQITITGWVPSERVKVEIETARALVLPSFSENMPVAIMEALALGRPVVSTYIAGIPELVEPGKSGWLVPAGDVSTLADVIQEVLTASVEQLTTMGDAGRAHIIEQHNAMKEALKLKMMFESGKSLTKQKSVSKAQS